MHELLMVLAWSSVAMFVFGLIGMFCAEILRPGSNPVWISAILAIFYRRVEFKALFIREERPWWMGTCWSDYGRCDTTFAMVPFNRIASGLRKGWWWLRDQPIDPNRAREFANRIASLETSLENLRRMVVEAPRQPAMSVAQVEAFVRYELCLRMMAAEGCKSPIEELGTSDDPDEVCRIWTCLEAMKAGRMLLQKHPRARVAVDRPCYACAAKQALEAF